MQQTSPSQDARYALAQGLASFPGHPTWMPSHRAVEARTSGFRLASHLPEAPDDGTLASWRLPRLGSRRPDTCCEGLQFGFRARTWDMLLHVLRDLHTKSGPLRVSSGTWSRTQQSGADRLLSTEDLAHYSFRVYRDKPRPRLHWQLALLGRLRRASGRSPSPSPVERCRRGARAHVR